MSAICIIPARGGSTRIPRKNIRRFHGRPIIFYSIDAAKQSGLFDTIVVSTDDDEISDMVAQNHVAALQRSAAMSRNEVGTQEVTRDVLLTLEASPMDIVCCLYPTAPLMSLYDFEKGYKAIQDGFSSFALSVGMEPLCDAGQFYWGGADAFIDRDPLISPTTAMIPVAPGRVCDINTEEDWARAERMYTKLREERL